MGTPMNDWFLHQGVLGEMWKQEERRRQRETDEEEARLAKRRAQQPSSPRNPSRK
jgi:hypothetical protein